MKSDEILALLRVQLPELRRQFGVRSLELFGSYVRAEESPGSDVDVLVEFDRVPGLFDFVRLQERLSSLLGLKVDLVMKDALRPGIAANILREAVPA